jgi:hypothetical protein
LSRTWSEPYAKDSAAKLPGKGNRLSQLSERSETRRLSKKEKKFQLSKDDGSYAELKPVNPHDAKKEFGNTLKLNPVGPAFQQAAASAVGQGGAEQGAGLGGGDGDHVTTAHNVVESEGNIKILVHIHFKFYMLGINVTFLHAHFQIKTSRSSKGPTMYWRWATLTPSESHL